MHSDNTELWIEDEEWTMDEKEIGKVADKEVEFTPFTDEEVEEIAEIFLFGKTVLF